MLQWKWKLVARSAVYDPTMVESIRRRSLTSTSRRTEFEKANLPQQNGVAERKNRHLAETCRSMLHAKNVRPRIGLNA